MTYGTSTSSALLDPFWAAAREGRLVLQYCTACNHIRFPPTAVCPRCLNTQQSWRDASGKGWLESLVEFHRAYWNDDKVPYSVCLVRLAEGPLLISNLVGDAARADLGAEVRVVFERGRNDMTLPKFTMAGTAVDAVG